MARCRFVHEARTITDGFDARPRPARWRANLRELMERMGHNTARAAMVYLHGIGFTPQRGLSSQLFRMVLTVGARSGAGWACPCRDPQLILQLCQRGGVKGL